MAREVEKLRQEVHVMRTSMLENEIDDYLSETEALHGAQGGDALQGVTIHASFTTVFQGTVGQGSGAEDIGVVDGDMDLQFDFQVTDNLNLFFNATANTSGAGSLPNNYPATNISFAATAGGFTDGIGVNGTVPVAPGSIRLEEGGIRQLIPAGSTEIWNEMGKIDPRDRFMQSAFADDANTGFINNNVDDNPAFLWLTNAGGTNPLGWHITITFGNNKQYSVNFGWFAPPGQWFARGQLYAQFSMKLEVSGREMNIRVAGTWQNLIRNPGLNETSDAGGGLVWDWLVTDKMGLFVKVSANGGDINPVDFDGSVGLVWTGIIGSRPNDAVGVSVSFITINTTVTGPIPEDGEFMLEIYYRYTMEDGKLQITPHIMYVMDPGGGQIAQGGSFTDDSLFILGLRIHVPF
ncbi:MAG: carbohydrate porin [Planctomycetota bacterium]